MDVIDFEGFAELPTELRACVESTICEFGLDVLSPAAMRGECERVSGLLARSLPDAMVDEDGDEWSVEAWPVQLFDVPAGVADDPMAHGHYVCRVIWGLDEYYIDLTAAQFAGRLSHTGPVCRTWHGW